MRSAQAPARGSACDWRRQYSARGNPMRAFSSYVLPRAFVLSKSGAEGQNRTADTMIFSHVLYRLSYLGLFCSAEQYRT